MRGLRAKREGRVLLSELTLELHNDIVSMVNTAQSTQRNHTHDRFHSPELLGNLKINVSN